MQPSRPPPSIDPSPPIDDRDGPDATVRRALLTRLFRLTAAASLASTTLACGGGGGSSPSPAPVAATPTPTPTPSPAPTPAPSPAPTPPPPTAPAGAPRATTLTTALSSPWGLAFLPDGRMLVTQKGGSMRLLSAAGTGTPVAVTGVPAVVDSGQGGLLDVVLDPDYATDPWIYFAYSEAGANGTAGTAVARARLVGTALQDLAVIFRQLPKVTGSGHFGSRLAFRSDKTLFISLGERQLGSPAQDLTGHLGKVVRIQRDGTLPSGNPTFGAGARPELWSIGHRNPQGAAIHPTSGDLWLIEHGPQGGDELNHVRAGGNYGWPIKSYGCDYGAPVGDTCRIGGGTHAPNYVEPVSYWVPTSIAPSGLIFYTGAGFPEWQGNAIFGALAGTALWRVALNGDTETAREPLFASLGERWRCVRQGPDGWIYALTDTGKLIRIDH